MSKQNTLEDAVRTLVELKDLHAEAKKRAATIHKEIETLSFRVIPQMLENLGESSATFPDIQTTVSLAQRYSVTMLDKPQCFQWLRDNNAEALITDTVHHGSLSAFVKDLVLTEGIDAPSDIFKVSAPIYAKTTKARPKRMLEGGQ